MVPRFRKSTYRIEVTGIVQGVGFRPFIYRLAQELGLAGFVFNHDRGVTIEVEGTPEALRTFVDDISRKAPPAAKVENVQAAESDWKGYKGFEIRESPAASSSKFVPVSPDLAICDDCRREIWDVEDRRFFYPFTNCTNCGPRFTIVQDVPYDRRHTTMSAFKMCASCQAEYDNPDDRRFHAQPNACPQCGPQLTLADAGGKPVQVPVYFNRNKTMVERCASLLKQGAILAIKGIGGFHLACDARNEKAVQLLRNRKHREAKPFAVMFPDLDSASSYAEISYAEAELLHSSGSPIVLVRKRTPGGAPLAEAVAPGNHSLGVMIPYSPLHELLVKSFGGPLVMTSGNRSDEPIAYSNQEAVSRLGVPEIPEIGGEQGGHIADYFLLHDREIHVRCDDSVLRLFRKRPYFLRRSRGYAPEGIRTNGAFGATILGVGGELKNAFCLARETREAHAKSGEAILGHHIGDLENVSTLQALEEGVAHFSKLFNLTPDCVAHDLHPDYLGTKWTKETFRELSKQGRVFAIQHHHAHIAACMEDAFETEPVIGLAFDGTGYGTDGTMWGGEILLADRRDFLRVGHFRNVWLPGGDRAVKSPWRIALAYLHESAIEIAGFRFLSDISEDRIAMVQQMLEKKLNCFSSSSCGRLFDAVSAFTGIVREARYEAQAAIELEQAIGEDFAGQGSYEFAIEERGPELELDWRPVIQGIAKDLRKGGSAGLISRKFHDALVRGAVKAVQRISERYSIRTVALSGGCFLNEYLLENLIHGLEAEGLKTIFHRRLSPNDGALSFGQVVVANQMILNKKSGIWQYKSS
ncbi:MAG: carbamoyltransferase HypF [Bdellovibrionales bacterium RIFOXYC1_FULL_54_43]|nr:MAG: carbamoyltransferase HypF [Bdellovibrionales bacterium RIFOXYC1_FULL_54_43]OFZ85676.1 MAG: carbamoyltransferase HypF [Bdellovibrionales bacterium RIFOXYD1_FULL_55_31]